MRSSSTERLVSSRVSRQSALRGSQRSSERRFIASGHNGRRPFRSMASQSRAARISMFLRTSGSHRTRRCRLVSATTRLLSSVFDSQRRRCRTSSRCSHSLSSCKSCRTLRGAPVALEASGYSSSAITGLGSDCASSDKKTLHGSLPRETRYRRMIARDCCRLSETE